MDFILSLTHFCEVHGPTSIICSQVLPFSCSQCYPDTYEFSPDDTPATSHDTRSSHGMRNRVGDARDTKSAKRPDASSATSDKSPKIEDSPYFLKNQPNSTEPSKLNILGGAEGDTCASCSLTLPDDVSKQLPPGAPGTASRDGKGRNGSPVLRSREVVYSCGTSHSDDDSAHDLHGHGSLPESVHSSSVASDASCHTHILTYLSLRGPPNPSDYALLRRSSIRTLSCELLPRGLSSGPLCFGDATAGYTIAYVFRLPDPMARGKRRSYALVALAGKDAGRAFRACPVIWRAFGRIATGIVNSAEKYQEEEAKRLEEQSEGANRANNRQYTPVSSFLTGRRVDPDGQPRRLGQIRARNLSEIVGNQYIFAEIHAHFVALLQQLGSMFGAVPISEERFICSTLGDDVDVKARRGSLVDDGKDSTAKGQAQSDFGLSGLNLSSGPKPIPIAPRRTIIA